MGRPRYPGAVQPVRATRYVTPLREGGSLPGLMEADDLGMYVVKFTGAGQGPRALVAEVICAELAAGMGLPVPRWTPIEVSAALAPAEPDEEVQHLLRASAGLNLGIDFLPGALDVGPMPAVPAELAGRIVWFDALVGNRDRSWRNPNMLLWHRRLQLIDHGATLTFHHSWTLDRLADQRERFASAPYEVADHALVECAPDVRGADAAFATLDWPTLIAGAVAAVPGEWLDGALGGSGEGGASVDGGSGEGGTSGHGGSGEGGPSGNGGGDTAARSGYREFLTARVAARGTWVPALAEAVARGAARDQAGRRVPQRSSSGPPDWLAELRIGREAP